MSVYGSVVFVHVLAATVLLGGGVFWLFTRSAIRQAESVAALRSWLDFARRTTRLNPVAALVVAGTGMYLGSFGWRASGWFPIAVALFVLNAFAAHGAGRQAAQLGKALSSAAEGPITSDLAALRDSTRWNITTDILLASDLATLFLMINKPGLWTGLAVAAAALVLPFVLARVRGGTSPWLATGRARSDA